MARKKITKALIITAAVAALPLLAWFALTSAVALVSKPAPPTASDVAAALDVYWQARSASAKKGGTWIVLGQPQLAGAGAVLSHGFRPDRIRTSVRGSNLIVEAAHRVWFRRWLNITLTLESSGRSFPKTHLTIGRLAMAPMLSRLVLGAAWSFLRFRRPNVPPLNAVLRGFNVKHGSAEALLSLSGKNRLMDELAGVVARPAGAATVIRIYCTLVQLQQKQPSSEFTDHVRRAFSIPVMDLPRPDANAAAFIALGMLLVDERVGDLAQVAPADPRICRHPPIDAAIYGRSDWAEHWTLSAALAVSVGTQLSEAAGEWKELSDSVSRQPQFAIGDPSGFSMADLAADRAGFTVARLATQPDRAEELARQLAKVTPQQLLPRELITREDRLSSEQFIERYGGVGDRRFKARVQQIDESLAATGLR